MKAWCVSFVTLILNLSQKDKRNTPLLDRKLASQFASPMLSASSVLFTSTVAVLNWRF